MNNISLFKKITFINVVVLLFFISLFIVQNNKVVISQMKTLEYEKYFAIAKNAQQTISINLSLGLDSGYKEVVENLLALNNAIYLIEILDQNMKNIYSKKSDTQKALNTPLSTVTVKLKNSLNSKNLGVLKISYTPSYAYKNVISEYNTFIYRILLISLLMIFFMSIIIYYTLQPLRTLSQALLMYVPGERLEIKTKSGTNEVAVITNAAINMLGAIEKEYTNRLKFEKELAHKNKLISMGEMIENIAHQWRQPLMNINAILANIDRSMEIKKLNEASLKSKTLKIANLTEHMSQTIEDFRSFFSKDKIFEKVLVSEIIDDALNLLKPLLNDIVVNTDKVQKLETHLCKNEFIQVLINLITNSIDILTQREIKKKEIHISVLENEKYINIIISDNGGGVLKENIDKIFEPYYTTKHKYGGTGLGLYICQMIIESSLEGNISAANTNEGLALTIQLKKEKL